MVLGWLDCHLLRVILIEGGQVTQPYTDTQTMCLEIFSAKKKHE